MLRSFEQQKSLLLISTVASGSKALWHLILKQGEVSEADTRHKTQISFVEGVSSSEPAAFTVI